jgi:hypothetical protein
MIFLSCFLSTACASKLSNAKVVCVERILDAKVVKLDNKNQRLFVVSEDLTVEHFYTKLKDIKACLNNSAWDSDWAISIFTKEKYAGYKDEKKIIPLHKNNEWAKAYKIEYLNSSGAIIRDPALSPKETKP